MARIHGFYLDALARLPKDELCSRYHHSLLKAGHRYGPLDPVSNIISNTIWYDKAYPPSKQFTIQMMSTSCLMRIVARSFYGLVSFMCARYPDRTVDQILQRLQEVNADLRQAASSFRGPDVQVAYNAAAIAASHPVPHQQQAFLGLPHSVHMLQLACTRVMPNDRILSSENVETIATFIMPPYADELYQQPHPEPRKVDSSTLLWFSRRCQQFWKQHELVLRKVEEALTKFNNSKVDFFSYFYSTKFLLLLIPLCLSYAQPSNVTLCFHGLRWTSISFILYVVSMNTYLARSTAWT